MMIPLLFLAAIDLAEVRSTAVDFLLDRQQNNIEWPYRGVYRVRGSQGLENPIGYRVGDCHCDVGPAYGAVADPREARGQ